MGLTTFVATFCHGANENETRANPSSYHCRQVLKEVLLSETLRTNTIALTVLKIGGFAGKIYETGTEVPWKVYEIVTER